MKRFVIILLTIILFADIKAQKLSKEEWIRDIEYLKQTLPDKHIDLFSLKQEDKFNRELDFLISKVNDLSDIEIAIMLKKTIVSLGDSYTDIKIENFIDDKKLPLQLFWFSDGLYVLQSIQTHKDIIEKKILKINDTPIEIISDSLSSLFININGSSAKKYIPELITNVHILKYFDFISDERIKITFSDGEFEEAKIIIPEPILRVNSVSFKSVATADYWENEKEFFTKKYIPESKMLYMQYNVCASKEYPVLFSNANSLPSFRDFVDKIEKDINELDIDKFVIDMRLNKGGSPFQGDGLIKTISQNEKINGKGKLYIIVGHATHSTAIINALSFKEETDAVFVGERTGEKVNSYSEMRTFDLPFSRMMVTYSTKYSSKYALDKAIIEPDFIIEESFDDFSNGVDPVLKWIEKQ